MKKGENKAKGDVIKYKQKRFTWLLAFNQEALKTATESFVKLLEEKKSDSPKNNEFKRLMVNFGDDKKAKDLDDCAVVFKTQKDLYERYFLTSSSHPTRIQIDKLDRELLRNGGVLKNFNAQIQKLFKALHSEPKLTQHAPMQVENTKDLGFEDAIELVMEIENIMSTAHGKVQPYLQVGADNTSGKLDKIVNDSEQKIKDLRIIGSSSSFLDSYFVDQQKRWSAFLEIIEHAKNGTFNEEAFKQVVSTKPQMLQEISIPDSSKSNVEMQKLSTDQTESLNKEIQELNAIIKGLEKKINTMQTETQGAEEQSKRQNSTIEKLNRELEAAQGELLELGEKQNYFLKMYNEKRPVLQEQVKNLEDAANASESARTQLNEELIKARKTIEETEEQVENLKKEREETTKKVGETEKNIKTLTAKLKQVEDEASMARQYLAQKVEEITKLHEEREKALADTLQKEQRIKEVENLLDEEKKNSAERGNQSAGKVKELESEIENLTRDNEQHKQSVGDKDAEIQRLEEEIKKEKRQHQATKNSANEANTNHQQALDAVKEDSRKQAERIKEFEADKQDSQEHDTQREEAFKKLKADFESLTHTNNQQMIALNTHKEEIQRLTDQLDTLRGEAEEGKENIRKKEDHIKEIEKEKQEAQERANQSEEKVKQLESDIAGLNRENTTEKQSVKEKEGQIEELNKILREKESEVEESNKELAKVRNEANKASEAAKENERRIKELEEAQAASEELSKKSAEDVQRLESEIVRLTEANQEATKKVGETEKKIRELTDELTQVTTKSEEAESELTTLKKRNKGLEEKIAEEIRKHQDTTSKASEADTKHQQDLEAFKEENQRLTDQLDTLRDEANKGQENIRKKEEHIEEIEKEKQEAKERANQSKERVTQLESDIEDLKDENDKAKQSISTHAEEIQKLIAQLTKVKEEASAKEETINELTRQLEEGKKEVSKVLEEIQTKKKDIEEVENLLEEEKKNSATSADQSAEKVRELESEVETFKQDNAQYKQSVGDKDDEIRRLQEEIEEEKRKLIAQRETFEAEKQSWKNDSAALLEEVQGLKGDVENSRNNDQKNNTRVRALKEEYNTGLESVQAQHRKNLAAIEAQHKNTKRQIITHHTKSMETLNKNLTEVKDKVNELEQTLQEARDENLELKEELKKKQATIDELQEKLARLNARVTADEKNNENLNQDLEKVRKQNEDFRLQNQGLRSERTDQEKNHLYQAEASKYQAEASKYREELREAQNTITILEQEIEALKREISATVAQNLEALSENDGTDSEEVVEDAGEINLNNGEGSDTNSFGSQEFKRQEEERKIEQGEGSDIEDNEKSLLVNDGEDPNVTSELVEDGEAPNVAPKKTSGTVTLGTKSVVNLEAKLGGSPQQQAHVNPVRTGEIPGEGPSENGSGEDLSENGSNVGNPREEQVEIQDEELRSGAGTEQVERQEEGLGTNPEEELGTNPIGVGGGIEEVRNPARETHAGGRSRSNSEVLSNSAISPRASVGLAGELPRSVARDRDVRGSLQNIEPAFMAQIEELARKIDESKDKQSLKVFARDNRESMENLKADFNAYYMRNRDATTNQALGSTKQRLEEACIKIANTAPKGSAWVPDFCIHEERSKEDLTEEMNASDQKLANNWAQTWEAQKLPAADQNPPNEAVGVVFHAQALGDQGRKYSLLIPITDQNDDAARVCGGACFEGLNLTGNNHGAAAAGKRAEDLIIKLNSEDAIRHDLTGYSVDKGELDDKVKATRAGAAIVSVLQFIANFKGTPSSTNTIDLSFDASDTESRKNAKEVYCALLYVSEKLNFLPEAIKAEELLNEWDQTEKASVIEAFKKAADKHTKIGGKIEALGRARREAENLQNDLHNAQTSFADFKKDNNPAAANLNAQTPSVVSPSRYRRSRSANSFFPENSPRQQVNDVQGSTPQPGTHPRRS